MKNEYFFKGEVWLWPGIGGFHFVNVPSSIYKNIRAKYGKGMIKIGAVIGKSNWTTALFPESKSKSYLISIKKSIRKKENIYKGDIVKIKFRVIK